MSIKHRLKFFEKDVLRPAMRNLRSALPRLGGPPELLQRMAALEARLEELEQVVQEDLGLKLARLDEAAKADNSDRI